MSTLVRNAFQKNSRAFESGTRTLSSRSDELGTPLASSELSPEIFNRYQTLIYRQAGIWLAPHKTALLVGRLSKRLRQLQIGTFSEYLELVTRPDQQEERTRMLDAVTTNETRFFREPRHFEFLASEVFPRWMEHALERKRSTRIRIWSAGCSSGEEPYSLAMMLLDHFGDRPEWSIEILASDISTQALQKAREGVFPIARATDIPEQYLSRYVLKGTEEREGYMKISPEIRKLVRFSRVNLYVDAHQFSEPFDVIFLRNVMIYFDQDAKIRVLAALAPHLAPEGYLFIGHSESLQGLNSGFQTVSTGVYRPAKHDVVKVSSKDRFSIRAGRNG